jgi:hypothetical protein
MPSDAFTGGFLWRAETGLPVESSPAVANGVVYVGSDDKSVHAVSVNGAPPAVARTPAPRPSQLHPDLLLEPPN